MSPFSSDRAKVWRNVMVTAINAGLDQGIFGLKPGETFGLSPGEKGMAEFAFRLLGFEVRCNVHDIGYDELCLHPCIFRQHKAWRPVEACAFDRRPLYHLRAQGWLERRNGAWLQTPRAISPSMSLYCRQELKPLLASMNVEPKGYADHGMFFP